MSTEQDARGKIDPIDVLVGKNIKNRRILLGLSQQDLGEAVGVSIQQIQKYEKATNRVSSGKLFAFSKLLKVPVSYFFDNTIESNILEHSFAEEEDEYKTDNESSNNPSEREIIALVKAYSEIKNSNIRKKVLELVKNLF